MMRRTTCFYPTALLLVALATMLTGCPHPDQYWQRTNTSQSVYMQGPKAQQTLHRDIQTCVTELKELERLRQLEDPIPTTFDGYIEEEGPSTLYRLKVESTDDDNIPTPTAGGGYTTFDSCMYAKGWERMRNLPYSITGTTNLRPRRDRPDPSTMQDIPRPPQYDPDVTNPDSMNK